MYEKFQLKNPAVIVDANHSNSGKQWDRQPRIVQEVLHSRSFLPEIESLVKGIMIESYIEDGNQSIGNGVYGQSITDRLSWMGQICCSALPHGRLYIETYKILDISLPKVQDS